MNVCPIHRYPSNEIKSTNASFPYFYQKLIDAGHRVKLISFKKFNRTKEATKLFKSLWFILYAPFLVLMSRVKWDIIYCDDSFPYYPALIKLISPKSKVIHYLGDFHLMYYFKGLIYKVLHYLEVICWQGVDKIIGITPTNANFVRQECGKIAPLVGESVDEREILSITPVTQKKGISAPIVMFHGLINKSKGLDMLLEVARGLPNVLFKIVGGGSVLPNLKRKAPPNVIFTGWLPPEQVKEHIATCDIGIAMRSFDPANQYNFTTAFLQYSIMKKPVIVPKKQCYWDIGWSYNYTNEYQLKLLIEQLLLDKYLRDSAGQRAYDYVKANHEAKKVAEDRYREVINV